MASVFILANNELLTGTAVAATGETGGTGTPRVSGDLHPAFIQYDPDTNSNNALEVAFEISPDDGVTYYPVGAYTNSSGTLTKQAQTISEASAGTSAQILPPYTFEGTGTHVRVLISETNTPADFGNVTITLLSRSSGGT